MNHTLTLKVGPNGGLILSMSGAGSAFAGPADASRCNKCGRRMQCPTCNTCHGSCDAKTQKAIGVASFSPRGIKKIEITAILPVTCESIEHWAGKLEFPIFARPCPVRPRHGFVDSKVVKDLAELREVIEATRVADPEGEVMLLPFLNPKWNAIWAPGLLTIGPGHDGATAGGSGKVLSLTTVPTYQVSHFSKARIAEGEVPYIEIVGGGNDLAPTITQVRSGTAIDGATPVYIPRRVEVTRVIDFSPEISLLAWESLMEEAGKDAGAVVYHPTGTITDHASVHARSRQVPLLTTRPGIGDVLQPIAGRPGPDPQAVLRGIVWGDGLTLKRKSCIHAVRLILHGLHHSSVIEGEWIGLAASLMLRLGSIALRGEARHHRKVRSRHAHSRNDVYLRHMDRTLSFHRASVGRLVNHFRYGDFGYGKSCSVGGTGGMAWASCAAALIPLFTATRDLARTPTQDAVGAIIRGLNRAVHQAHNGGWWLNKFVEGHTEMFDAIPLGSWSEAIAMIPFLWDQVRKSEPSVEVTTRRRIQYAGWPDTVVPVPSITGAKLRLLEGGMYLEAKARNLLGPICVPVVFDKFSPTLSRFLKLGWNHEGRCEVVLDPYGLEAKAGGTAPDPAGVLWQEPSLTEIVEHPSL